MLPYLQTNQFFDESHDFVFPPVSRATREGIVCLGGNLSPGMLLSAYRRGIFPWYSDDEPIIWWSPDPRFCVLPSTLHVPGSAKRLINKHRFNVTADTQFKAVITECAEIERPGQPGTWITPEMREAYIRLHELGYAHSIEVWENGVLAGGLYGVSLGRAFFGESMFSKVSGASRAGFLTFAAALFEKGYELIDSQVHTDYVASMGGVDIPRARYLALLSSALKHDTQKGSWTEFFVSSRW